MASPCLRKRFTNCPFQPRPAITVVNGFAVMGWAVCDTFPSPILGHAGNREVFALLTRA
ncbi:MAG: hypothetical protein WBE26_20735 [Phycisphaerae bacterium]